MDTNKEQETKHDIAGTSETDNILGILDNLDKAIIRAIIEQPDVSNTELGKRFNVNRDTIARRLKKEKVKYSISELQRTALDILLNNQAKAARRIIKEIDSDDPAIAIKACKEVLTGVLAKTVNINSDIGPVRRFLNSLSDEDLAGYDE